MQTPNSLLDQHLGLTAKAAAKHLLEQGYNELPSSGHRGFLRILSEVLREPMFILLIGGGVVYLLLGDLTDALLLLLFATFSVTITIVQESRSESVLESLRNLASPRALVIRDGKRIHILGREVVCDDIIVLNEGDRVVADATLISSHDLLVDESLLTGESIPVRKLVPSSALTNNPVAGGEDLPYVFAGTLVVRGTGKARVHATATNTEMGKIGRALGSIKTEQTQLRMQIQWLIRDFAIIGVLAGGLVVVLYGLLRGSWLDALLGGISIGMSLLPQEFTLVMAVFMAMGAWRISQARVLTRRASAIETLGAITVLCTDKTGTLTENLMKVAAIINGEEEWAFEKNTAITSKALETLQVSLWACPLEPSDNMDIAIHKLAVEHDALTTYSPEQLLHTYGLRPDLFVFVNVIKNDQDENATAYAKGALEAIVELCDLSSPQLTEQMELADKLAKQGIRVLAVAKAGNINTPLQKTLPKSPRGFKFEYVGLIGFADPLRKHVPAAIAECHSAGIRVIMITGDYPATALAIGKQAGIDVTNIVTGDDIESMSDRKLGTLIKTTSIFARVRPNQKLRIVQSLKTNGEIVGMTGDGVNDAPAIKAAHIGIAMGNRGTDVAREASAIVLLDDDFGAIVKTIHLGRRIYDNLRKAIEYIVAVHIPIAGLAILPLLLGLPLVLTPVHIAFLEMVIDPACSVVFEAEKEEENVMKRPPRKPKVPLLLPKRILWAVLQGLIVLSILSAILIIGSSYEIPENDLRALVFSCLVVMNMGLILVNRSFNASLMSALFRPNRSLWILLSSVSVVLIIAIYWVPASQLFHFGQLDKIELAICVSVGVLGLMVLEGLKSLWFQLKSSKSSVSL